MGGNAACTTCLSSPDSCFPMEQAMWTDHCLQHGDSTFPTTLIKETTDTVVQKGMNKYVDAYSGFMDNTQTLKTTLDEMLQGKGINQIYVVGIATDVCVQWTVTDALGSNTANYDVTVVKDATAAVLGDVDNYNYQMSWQLSAPCTHAVTSKASTRRMSAVESQQRSSPCELWEAG